MEDASARVTAAIGLGSNLGDRAAHLQRALNLLGELPETRLQAASSFIETEPLPRPDGRDPGGPYLNAAAILETRLEARELLNRLLDIERAAGRDRGGDSRGKWAPRTLDLDLLLYGERIIEEEGLSIPHPRLHERAFVLRPLAEVAPALSVPGSGATVADLLARLQQECSS